MTQQITINKTETEGFAARIQNRGQSNGTQTVELYKDGVLVTDETNLTLTPDETTYVLEAPTVFSTANDGDILTMEVVTDNMTRTINVFIKDAIPDSAVSRTPDDNSASFNEYLGLRVSVSVGWPKRFDGRISQNTSGATRARLIRVSDSTTLDTVDISGLSAGNVFSFTLSNPLSTSEVYDVVLDANGSSWTCGFTNDANAPFTSSDGNVTIETGVRETLSPPESSNSLNAVSEVGNLA